MQTKEYRTFDKSSWGDGPWQNEPDKMQYSDAETGLPCLIVRGRSTGGLCGYVGVLPGHPAHGGHYDAIDVEVHGGLTFSNVCQPVRDESIGVCHRPDPGEPDNVYWLGFDCGHAYDYLPALEARYSGTPDLGCNNEDVYRDISYVRAQIKSLAGQLHAMKAVAGSLD